MEILKKNKTIVIISIISLFLILSIIICFVLMPEKEEKMTLNSNIFPELDISTTLESGNITGKTLIRDANNNFILNGTFENGVFKEGTINILHDGITYVLEGTFENFNIKEGTMMIFTKDKIIIKEGFFVDNKLEGLGHIQIKDKSGDNIFFDYAGKFENDTPIY